MEQENQNIKMGIRDGLPIAIGYFAVSFAFGLLCTGQGLTVLEALFISMFNVTSAGQIAALPIIASGGTLVELALTQIVINSRYALMSVSLSQKLGKSVRLADRFLIGFMNTDEIFAVATGKGGAVGRKYLYSLIVTPFLGWTLGTLFGAVAGDILPKIVVTALSVSMYAMFIAIVVPVARASRPVALVALCALLLSCLFAFTPKLNEIPSGFVIIIVAVSVSALFALLCPLPDEKEDTEGEEGANE